MRSRQALVVVGAGLAGGRAAEVLARDPQSRGNIVVLGDEADPPYRRPAVSKDLLVRPDPEEPLFLRPADYYERNGIALELSRRAVGLDPRERLVHLADGEEIPYGKLLVATGSRARRIAVPGSDLERVHYLRTLADSSGLRETLTRAGDVVVIGGGFIGLEVAAAAVTAHGCSVVVVEQEDEPASAALGMHGGSLVRMLHEKQGVRFRLSSRVAELRGERGSVRSVVLDDGETLRADCVVVGVGSGPNTEWLQGSGIELSATGGVIADRAGRTTAEDVYVAGDIAELDYPGLGPIRSEHEAGAQVQGMTFARGMLGLTAAPIQLPYVWSTQYAHRLEFVGDRGEEELTFTPPDRESAVTSFASGGRMRGVFCVDSPEVVGRFQAAWSASRGDVTVEAWHEMLRGCFS